MYWRSGSMPSVFVHNPRLRPVSVSATERKPSERATRSGAVADGDLVRCDDPVPVQVPIPQQRARPDTVHRIADATLDRVEAGEGREFGHTRRQRQDPAVVGGPADTEIEDRVPPAQHLDV